MADRKKTAGCLTPRQKLALIRLLEGGKESITSVCRRYGVSRKTFYKWRRRYYAAREQKQSALFALSPKKRTYHRKKPRPTDRLIPEITETVKKDPTLSVHRIAKLLRISSKGVWGVLKRLGLSREKQRKEFRVRYIPRRSLSPRKKLALIQLVERGELGASQACQRYGISRKTFYKWRSRYHQAKAEKKSILSSLSIKEKFFDPSKKHANSSANLFIHEVLEVVKRRPSYSVHEIAPHVSLSSKGVWSVLKKLNLSREGERRRFQRFYLLFRPWLAIIFALEYFLGGAVVPEIPIIYPLLSAIPKRRRPIALYIPLLLLAFGAGWRFNQGLFTMEPSLFGRVGLVLSEIALIFGMFFFIYSVKYYLTLALVLTSSRQINGAPNGNGLPAGRQGFRNGLKNGLNGLNGGNGRLNGFLNGLNGKRNGRLNGLLNGRFNGLKNGLNGRLNGFNGLRKWLGLGNGLNGLNGHLNGEVNGGLNGRLNGKVNGRLNGLINGRLNGLLNGRFNGLLNGRLNGFKNGLNGLNGFRNGLNGINGLSPFAKGSGGSTNGLNADNLNHIKLKEKPFVSIHLPFYNEKRVAGRILEACSKLNYPNFEVLVVDDSNDGTTEIVREWSKRDPRIKLLHRFDREGWKGGALRHALTKIDPKAQFVVVFDADFIPFPDTLDWFLRYFHFLCGGLRNVAKSKIAAVQGYQWHVLNKDENWITRGVRGEYAGSYIIERSGAELLGSLKQIAGSVYMIRADLLKQFGWGTSITEDFQLTLRLYEQGYKVIYTPYIQAPAECVATIKRLIRQRMRWAEGHTHNVRKMFSRLWYSPKMNLTEKLEFLYLSPYYLQSLLFLVGTLSWLAAEIIFRSKLPFWTATWGWSLVFTNMFSLLLMNTVGLFIEESDKRDYQGLLSFLAMTYLIVPFQAYAAVKGFFEKEEGHWFRTPKTGLITIEVMRGHFARLVGWLLPRRAGERVRRRFVTEIASYHLKPILAFQPAYDFQQTAHRFYRTTKRRFFSRGVAVVLLIGMLFLNYASFFVPPTILAQAQPTIEQQINIIDQEITSGRTDKGIVCLNPSKYTGATWNFEIVAQVTSRTGTAVLTYDAGACGSAPTGGSTVTISNITAISYTRYRTSFTPTSNGYNAYVSSLTGIGISVKAARIVIVQTDATMIDDTETQVEVGNNETTTSTSPVELTAKKIYRYSSGVWSPTPTVNFEATLKAGAQEAGPNNPATGVQDTTVGTIAWESYTDSFTNNDVYDGVSLAKGAISYYNEATNFSFSGIPSDATIKGIKVEINGYVSNILLDDYSVKIVKGGTVTGTDHASATDWPTTDDNTYRNYGGTTDLWGVTWAVSDIQSTGFGVAFAFINNKTGGPATYTGYVDHIRITVTYAPQVTGTAYARLYTTGGTYVTGSEVSVNSATWTGTRTDSSISLSDGTDYVVWIYTSNASVTAYIANAKIILTQDNGGSGLTKMEIVHSYINSLVTDTDSAYTSQQYFNRYNPANWAAGTFTYLFESTLKTSTANTTTAYAEFRSPIAFDAASSSSGTGISSLSWSHTVGVDGLNRILVVGVSTRGVGGPPSPDVTNITYAGTALTPVGTQFVTGATPDTRIEIWQLVAPATGSNNVVITTDISGTIIGGATSWTGVHQTTPLGTFASTNGLNTSPSVNVTSAKGEVVVDAGGTPFLSTDTVTVGAGQTERWNRYSSGYLRGYGSSEDGASSVTMSWTLSKTENWALGAVPLKPSGTQISEITTNNASYIRVRSTSLTMPASADELDTGLKNSATSGETTSSSNSWLIIQVSSLQIPERVIFLLPLMLFLPKLVQWFRDKRQLKLATINSSPVSLNGILLRRERGFDTKRWIGEKGRDSPL